MISASLLFVLLVLFGAAAAVVVPRLSELLHTSPRLAMLGFLGFAISPAAIIAVAHRLGSSALDQLEHATSSRKSSGSKAVESIAAGAHGWLVLVGTSILTSLVMLVLQPPELDPDTLSINGMASHLVVAQVLSVHTTIWITIATIFFELQRRAKKA